MHVTLLYGGRSAEHDVSVRSARFVARTLCLQHTVMLIGITRRGVWYAQPACALEQLCTGTVALSIQEDEKRRVCLVPGGGTAGAFCHSGDAVCHGCGIPRIAWQLWGRWYGAGFA